LKERLGSGSALSESLLDGLVADGEYAERNHPPVHHPDEKADNEPEEPIDEVVVDNLLPSDGATHKTPSEFAATRVTPEKGRQASPDFLSSDREDSINAGQTEPSPILWVHSIWNIVRWRIFPTIHGFFVIKFPDEKMEAQFCRDAWFTNKRLAIWSRYAWSLLFYLYISPILYLC